MSKKIVLLAIMILAAFFRFAGVNWDQNQHLHPDERYLTMVTWAMKWPSSLAEYLDPAKSMLNPYNTKNNFFVYGVLPLVINKYFSQYVVLESYDYNNITLVGRLLSALFELGIVFLLYLIGKELFKNRIALSATFFYSIFVLPIQQAHFFTVDAPLVFFTTLSFYGLVIFLKSKGSSFQALVLTGLSLGLGLACKVTAVYLLPFITLAFVYLWWQKAKPLKLLSFFIILLFLICSFFRLADPRVFAGANWFDWRINLTFIDNLKQLQAMSGPESLSPPNIQWIATKPIIYPLKNFVLWGVGLPLAVVLIAGWFFAFWCAGEKILFLRNGFKALRKAFDVKTFVMLLASLWVLFIFVYQGVQFAKTMRYFYLMYPFLAILGAYFVNKLWEDFKKYKLFFWLYGLVVLIYPLSFISIYLKPHSRVQASNWIYANVPPGSSLSCESWDDCLPVSLPYKNSSMYKYKVVTLNMFNNDKDFDKWTTINQQLKTIDCLLMSSNRVWGSTMKAPELYPRTTQYYKDLFEGKLDFQKAAEFTSYPCFPPVGKPWFCFDDSGADENFTVFDHPKVLIYKKK